MSYYPYIAEQQALKCNLGIPAKCIWETITTGYRADIWQHNGEMAMPVYSKEFITYKEAKSYTHKKLRELFQINNGR